MLGSLEGSQDKNAALKARYGVGFDDVILALRDGGFIGVRAHPNREQYSHQQQLLVLIGGYVWVVPFVRSERGLFLKTLFPSRKANKAYRETIDD